MSEELTLERVEAIIGAVFESLREDLGLSAVAVSSETPIMGGGSDFDSMAVVHLIADLETRLEEAFGRVWILADERALSRTRSPFRTVGDLARHILETADA